MKEAPLMYLLKQQEILYKAVWYHEDLLNDSKNRLLEIEYLLKKHAIEKSSAQWITYRDGGRCGYAPFFKKNNSKYLHIRKIARTFTKQFNSL
jgi:hypothetical protein